jgi:hypothetical protein
VIRVWKVVEAIATCRDRTDGVFSDGRRLLRTEISVSWYFPDGEDASDMDDLEWKAVLRLLQRASKRSYNMHGGERSEEEGEQMDWERAQLFYIGDRARLRGEY